MNKDIVLPKIIAFDFDGTLVEDKFPKIGEPNYEMINFCKLVKQYGAKIILWTCRTGDYLESAVKFCKEQGIEFDAVNDNIPEAKEKYNGDARKVFANLYVEDKAVTPKDDFFSPLRSAGFTFDETMKICDKFWRM